jgi:hypothetical protein
MAFPVQPCWPARIRVNAPAHGLGTCLRLVARAPALRPPGPGRTRAPRLAARSPVAPGPRTLYEPAAGPSRAPPALPRDLRFRVTRRTRGPVGSAAAPPTTWWSQRQPRGRGGDVTDGPGPRRPCWAQGKRWSRGRRVPPPQLAGEKVWKAQHQLTFSFQPPAKQVSVIKSPVPGWFTQCLRRIYAVFTQCLRSVYEVFTQCLRMDYLCIIKLHRVQYVYA